MINQIVRLDILPNLLESKPNISSLSFLELDKLELKKVVEVKNILVTFGGQDPYNLTEDCVAKLRGKYNVTTIIGPLFKTKDFGVEKIESPKSLKDIIPKYDLVITSFGLTPFESISYGTPVALVNPTDYHRSLSKKAGFHQLGDNLGINIKKIIKDCSKIQIEEPKSITDFLYSMEFTNNPCPVCLRKNGGVIERYRNKTYFNCDHCKMDYLNNHTEEIVYSEDYFFTDYKKQYGKTYLEDFDHIKNMGFSRLKSILKKAKKGSTILDIGCAYGPFLSAAEDVGLIPKGIDISKDATDYVNKTLGIEAYPSAFPIKTELFKYLDIITMWFVIEHFKNINDVLIQINRLLKKGGVFAFSTPNAKGISGVKNYYNFLDNSPNDHFTLWNKKNSINVLRQFGFKVYKINVTGHHPERFTRLSKNRVIFKIVNLISKVLGLGDTFEVYCVKERNL